MFGCMHEWKVNAVAVHNDIIIMACSRTWLALVPEFSSDISLHSPHVKHTHTLFRHLEFQGSLLEMTHLRA
jgi:hypothetical protein